MTNYPPGYVEPDEPGRWFEALEEAPVDTKCHLCSDTAELKDEDDQLWCGSCAGEHDFELRLEDPDMP